MLTDKQDYDEIYQKYKNLVMKAAYKYSGNYDIAEDITVVDLINYQNTDLLACL